VTRARPCPQTSPEARTQSPKNRMLRTCHLHRADGANARRARPPRRHVRRHHGDFCVGQQPAASARRPRRGRITGFSRQDRAERERGLDSSSS
jgi:hypothetical protein